MCYMSLHCLYQQKLPELCHTVASVHCTYIFSNACRCHARVTGCKEILVNSISSVVELASYIIALVSCWTDSHLPPSSHPAPWYLKINKTSSWLIGLSWFPHIPTLTKIVTVQKGRWCHYNMDIKNIWVDFQWRNHCQISRCASINQECICDVARLVKLFQHSWLAICLWCK